MKRPENRSEEEVRTLKRLTTVHRVTERCCALFEQLAEVCRHSGHEGFARQVAIAREKARGRQPDLSLWVRAWRRFLGVTVAYGYEPGRALALFVVLLAVGWLIFAQPPAKRAMIPARHVINGPDSAAEDCRNYPCFSPLVYIYR